MLPNKLQITHSLYHNNDLLKEGKATREAGHLKPSPPKKIKGLVRVLLFYFYLPSCVTVIQLHCQIMYRRKDRQLRLNRPEDFFQPK